MTLRSGKKQDGSEVSILQKYDYDLVGICGVGPLSEVSILQKYDYDYLLHTLLSHIYLVSILQKYDYDEWEPVQYTFSQKFQFYKSTIMTNRYDFFDSFYDCLFQFYKSTIMTIIPFAVVT